MPRKSCKTTGYRNLHLNVSESKYGVKYIVMILKSKKSQESRDSKILKWTLSTNNFLRQMTKNVSRMKHENIVNPMTRIIKMTNDIVGESYSAPKMDFHNQWVVVFQGVKMSNE